MPAGLCGGLCAEVYDGFDPGPTRGHEKIKLGASPRASLGLYLASQAKAAIQGRNYVIPDDVKSLAVPVLAHRFIVKTEARMKGQTSEDIMKEILSAVPVPAESK